MVVRMNGERLGMTVVVVVVVVMVVVVVVVVGYFIGPVHIRKINKEESAGLTIGLNRPNTHFLCL